MPAGTVEEPVVNRQAPAAGSCIAARAWQPVVEAPRCTESGEAPA